MIKKLIFIALIFLVLQINFVFAVCNLDELVSENKKIENVSIPFGFDNQEINFIIQEGNKTKIYKLKTYSSSIEFVDELQKPTYNIYLSKEKACEIIESNIPSTLKSAIDEGSIKIEPIGFLEWLKYNIGILFLKIYEFIMWIISSVTSFI